MALRADNYEKIDRLLERDPNVTIFLRAIAAPAALGLAGFARTTRNGALPPHPIHEHFPELAAWMIALTFFTWSGQISYIQAIASSARDLILCAVLTALAIGSTIACCMFAYGSGVRAGMKATAYFWIISSIMTWWRVTFDLVVVKFFPIFRTWTEQKRPLLAPGYGEPGVKRGMPGLT